MNMKGSQFVSASTAHALNSTAPSFACWFSNFILMSITAHRSCLQDAYTWHYFHRSIIFQILAWCRLPRWKSTLLLPVIERWLDWCACLRWNSPAILGGRTGIICLSRPAKKPLLLQVTPPPSIDVQRIVLESMRRKQLDLPPWPFSITRSSTRLTNQEFYWCSWAAIQFQKSTLNWAAVQESLLFIPLAHWWEPW